MARVLCVGSAVVDFVFRLDALPTRPEKLRALDARMVGGGCAANAAVAVARLG
jgi:sulfofructose kinase